MNFPRRIVIAGAAHVDRTGWLDRSSQPGCSNPGRFVESSGGTGLNVASVLAVLGHRPVLLTQVGSDAAGHWILQQLRERNVEVVLSGEPASTSVSTGTYTSIIEPDGGLLIAVADMAIYDTFQAEPFLDRVRSLGSKDWLCVDTNLPPDEVRKLLAATRATRVGLTVSMAKAPRLRHWAGELDMLFTNQVEARSLCALDQSCRDDVLIAALRALQLSNVVISNGNGPVTLVAADKVHSLPIRSVRQIADVTGAGDALVAASLHALLDNQTLADAVAYGIRAAGATIGHKGSICPDLGEILGPPGTNTQTSPDLQGKASP